MPTYRVTDQQSGKTLRLTGDSPPTEEELNDIFSKIGEGEAPKTEVKRSIPGRLLFGAGRNISDIAKGTAQTIAHPINTLEGIRTYVQGAGGELRSLMGWQPNPEMTPEQREQAKQVFDPTKQAIAESIAHPGGIPGRLATYAIDNPVNAALFAAPGTTLSLPGRALKPLARPMAGLAKEIVGATTGAGPGFIEEAVKGSRQFQRAMRGQITGEEIVDNAKSALQTIVKNRGDKYRRELDQIRLNPQQMSGIKSGVEQELTRLSTPDNFDLSFAPNPKGGIDVDFTKSTIIEHQPVVRKAIEDVVTWKDNSAAGLDTLKKRLSTYIDQAGQRTPAQAMLKQLQKSLDKGLKDNIPGYVEMTRGYAEATNLIKDIESNLMLRKEGMTGRITSDQTLRRLTSALRQNFEMRKDLLEALGQKSGADIASQVAGYAATSKIPWGTMRQLGAGGGAIYMLSHLNPKLWPILAASSPRVVGEFLNAYGKASNEMKKFNVLQRVAPAGRGLPITGMAQTESDKKE